MLTLNQWPDCPVAGCENKCCLRLESPYCYPHSIRPQDEVIKQLDRIADNTLEPVLYET